MFCTKTRTMTKLSSFIELNMAHNPWRMSLLLAEFVPFQQSKNMNDCSSD